MSNSKIVRLQAVMLVGYGGKLPEGPPKRGHFLVPFPTQRPVDPAQPTAIPCDRAPMLDSLCLTDQVALAGSPLPTISSRRAPEYSIPDEG
ncbi:hypothetical protein EAI_13896 [Harpegnathos saltator]|uniref:Uncharacterized protein n=1 Tax=Harpegnathos saltator TaxID=610380 RepID=E2BJU3_HARSA|nr:hypothetical protein EAI_13896 [Harpegnathos saltator]